jgi:hypothetical protein
MKDQSMKRLPALVPLSRDHGVELVCAQYGRKAIRAPVDDRLRLTEQMREICRDVIGPNLEDEQWILSSMIGDDHLRDEFHQRHRNIKELTTELCGVGQAQDPGVGLVARVANALDDYVRWEQHTLYPRIEDGSEHDQLQQLSELTASMETKRNRPTQRLHSSVTLQQPSGLRTISI